MVAVNIPTILIEFVPPLIVTIIYGTFFRNRRNKFIEAFIALMYVKVVTFFLYWIGYFDHIVAGTYDPIVDSNTFVWVLFTDFLFQFAYALQEYLTWIMISFIAVLFGMLVLALRLALQDPLKMKFKNLIKTIIGREPESDGYSGLGDRLDHVHFEGLETQPLDPEVMNKRWSESWKDYLIIGLATILPSISAYLGSVQNFIWGQTGNPNYVEPNNYILGILIFLTWIYRFGYPASNRIAKGAGIKLGDRDLGDEMMRGVLGWFFRLNVLLSLGTIVLDAITLVNNPAQMQYFIQYYILGLAQAAPPIIFAIILLPLAESFSEILYVKAFNGIKDVKKKASGMNIGESIKTFVASVGTGTIVAAGAVGAIMGVTLNYAFWNLGSTTVYPGEVDIFVRATMSMPFSNVQILPETIWTLMVLMIPLGAMLLTGVLAHYVRCRTGGGMEGFAFFTGFVVSTLVYFLLPGLDYTISPFPTAFEFNGILFYRARPVINLPVLDPSVEFYRYAYQFVVNMPIYISAALFALYFFKYRNKWREHIGEDMGPLLNVERQDVIDVVAMFALGIVGSVIGVLILSYIVDPGFLHYLMYSLIIEIGNPNGLELVLADMVSEFVIVTEHNIIRTLIMLVIGPVFWSLVLWLVADQQKSETDKKVAYTSIVLLVVAGLGSFLWTWLDMMNGVFVPAAENPMDPNFPWTFAAHLGLRAVIVYGILFGAYFLMILVNKLTDGQIGGWWFPPILTLFALEYFVYDDQFTLIALIVLPMILAGLYKLVYGKFAGKPEVQQEDPLVTYIRFSLMSLAIAEVLSTALWVAGIGTIEFMAGNAVTYLAQILPHAVVEIPAFLFTAALSIRIARDLAPSVQAEDWSSITTKTRELLTDMRTWRTYALVMFFLVIAALIEENISRIVWYMFGGHPP